MSLHYQNTISLLSKPRHMRRDTEIESLLPWLQKQNHILNSVSKDVLMSLVRNSCHVRCQKDTVVITQGEIGDSFYIMLSGRMSIYIDPAKTGEDKEVPNIEDGQDESLEQQVRDELESELGTPLDRTKYGRLIGSYVAGDSFGEIALISKEALRNASIIADEESDLMQIDRNTYEGTLKAKQAEEYAEQNAFVENCPLFKSWSTKMRKLLEMSVKKIVLPFGAAVVKQGAPVEGLHFIVKGEAKIVIDTTSHEAQFPKLFDPSNTALAKELGRSFVKKVEKKRDSLQQEQVRVRRRNGYVAAEKRLAQKATTLCFVDENEVIGDAELALGLDTYAQSVICTANTELFLLDNKTIERFILKKYTSTVDAIRDKVYRKLKGRQKSKIGCEINLFKHMIDALEDLKPKRTLSDGESTGLAPKITVRDDNVRKKENLNKLLELYLQDKSPLLEHSVPGTVYYKAQSVEKARRRMMDKLHRYNERHKVITPQVRLERARKAARRVPRSRRELERLTVAQDPEEASKLYDRNHAINRFLTQGPGQSQGVNKSRPPPVQRSTLQTAPIFALTQPQTNGDVNIHDVDYSDIHEGDLKQILRDMGDHHETKTASRSRVICSMMDKGNSQSGDTLIGGLRPKSAPMNRNRNSWWYEDEQEEESFDIETSDKVLSSLEQKLKDFHRKHEMDGRRGALRIEQLKRFRISKPDDVPVPGGTVYVRQRECKFPPGSNVSSSQHQHVRRFIIPKDAMTIAAKALAASDRPDSRAPNGDINGDITETMKKNFRPVSAPATQNGLNRPTTAIRKITQSSVWG